MNRQQSDTGQVPNFYLPQEQLSDEQQPIPTPFTPIPLVIGSCNNSSSSQFQFQQNQGQQIYLIPYEALNSTITNSQLNLQPLSLQQGNSRQYQPQSQLLQINQHQPQIQQVLEQQQQQLQPFHNLNPGNPAINKFTKPRTGNMFVPVVLSNIPSEGGNRFVPLQIFPSVATPSATIQVQTHGSNSTLTGNLIPFTAPNFPSRGQSTQHFIDNNDGRPFVYLMQVRLDDYLILSAF